MAGTHFKGQKAGNILEAKKLPRWLLASRLKTSLIKKSVCYVSISFHLLRQKMIKKLTG